MREGEDDVSGTVSRRMGDKREGWRGRYNREMAENKYAEEAAKFMAKADKELKRKKAKRLACSWVFQEAVFECGRAQGRGEGLVPEERELLQASQAM